MIARAALALLLMGCAPPTFSASRVFFDGAESGNANQFDADDYRNKCTVVSTASDGVVGPYAGSYMFRCNDNGTLVYNDPAQFETMVIPPFAMTNEVLYRFRVRADQNHDRTGGSDKKWFRLFSIPAETSQWNDMYETLRPGNCTNNEGLINGNQFSTYYGCNPGDNVGLSSGWHTVEYYFNKANGSVKVWHDDVLIRNDNHGSIAGKVGEDGHMYMMSNMSATHDAVNASYVDDVEVFTDNNSGTAVTSGTMANGDITTSGGGSTFTVTPSAGGNGSIAPGTPQTVSSGATTAFTVTPNSGYTASVGGTCGGSLVGTTYTTNTITANCTVSATFADTTAPVLTSGTKFAGSPSTTQIDLKWPAATDGVGITSYEVQRCAGWGCTGYATVGTVGTTAFSNTGLTAEPNPTIYRYRIRACDAASNCSGYSGGVYASARPTIPAFDGAEGGGAVSKGGRGGVVYRVTSLANSGAGTLRECVEATVGPRTCVFAVAGNIDITSGLAITTPYITIAGHTAPGGGVTLMGKNSINDLLSVRTHNVIIRNVRFRKGFNAGTVGYDADSLNVLMVSGGTAVDSVIVANSSISWGQDENFSIWNLDSAAVTNPRNITCQYCLIYEGLLPTARAMLVGGNGNNSDDISGIDIHKSAMFSFQKRSPLFKGRSLRSVNNVMWNFELWSLQAGGGAQVDAINNLWRYGRWVPPTLPHEISIYTSQGVNTASGTPTLYVSGNIGPSNANPDADNWAMVRQVSAEGAYDPTSLSETYRRFSPLAALQWPITAYPSGDLDAILLPKLGAAQRLDCSGNWVSMRDAADAQIVAEYVGNAGSDLATTEDAYGGYPALASGTSCADADGDGMPDTWETAQGLNPSSATDGPTLHASGYSNLERYLAGSGDLIAPVLFGFGPASPLSAASTTATLALTTDEAATCRYSVDGDAAWAAMTQFSTTGGTSHSGTITVAKGKTDWYHVRCNDAFGNLSAPSVHRLSVGDTPKRRGSR